MSPQTWGLVFLRVRDSKEGYSTMETAMSWEHIGGKQLCGKREGGENCSVNS